MAKTTDTKATVKSSSAVATAKALKMFNSDYSLSWDYGTNWSDIGNPMFETFVNKYLFPKINETILVEEDLANRYEFLAREKDFQGQFSEEYVILDAVPVSLNLSKAEELMLKRNYPKMATKLYHEGIVKKQKFTLNNNDARLKFSSLQDGVSYAMAVFNKRMSDIFVYEESEIKALQVDYALTYVKEKRNVTSMQDLCTKMITAILNMQNNSAKYNEADTASGGALGRYTTRTGMKNFSILTTDDVKAYLLNEHIRNSFMIQGIDLTDKIISFDDLGGVYKLTDDVTISTQATVNYMASFGDYQVAIDDMLPKGAVITYDVSGLTEFSGKVEEVKPDSELFAYVFDIRKVRYTRNTKDMIKKPFFNGEHDEVTYWIHYYSHKAISPFYNSIVLAEGIA